MRHGTGLTRAIVACGAAVAAFGAPAHAQTGPWSLSKYDGSKLVKARLQSDTPVIGPGQTFHLAVVFDIEPAWHISWKNPGGGSMPPQISVTAPDGFQVGEPLFPRPESVTTPLGPEYCYSDQAALFVPVTAPADLGDGRAAFHLQIRWTVCKEVCVMGSARHSIEIDTAGSAAASRRWPDPVAGRFHARLPRPLESIPGAALSLDGSVLTVTGPARGRSTVNLYPIESPGVTFQAARASVTDDRFTVEVTTELSPHNALGRPMSISGLVVLGDDLDDPCYDFIMPLPARQGAISKEHR